MPVIPSRLLHFKAIQSKPMYRLPGAENRKPLHNGWMTQPATALNILGQPLQACSYDPLTGYRRDGCCNTDATDAGLHLVCAVMSQEFLEFSRSRGNDLITPQPQWRFKGLKPGNRWCLCALRWKEALQAGVAPKVVVASTHIRALDLLDLEDLLAHAHG